MELNIVIGNAEEADYLRGVAQENSLSPSQYATNIVVGWIQNQIKDIYIGRIKRLSTDEIIIRLGKIKE